MVPLSRQAVSVMTDVRKYTQGEHYVFHQLNNPKKPMSENTMLFTEWAITEEPLFMASGLQCLHFLMKTNSEETS